VQYTEEQTASLKSTYTLYNHSTNEPEGLGQEEVLHLLESMGWDRTEVRSNGSGVLFGAVVSYGCFGDRCDHRAMHVLHPYSYARNALLCW